MGPSKEDPGKGPSQANQREGPSWAASAQEEESDAEDNWADTMDLDGREARQLENLARDRGIDKVTGRKSNTLSLWRRLVSALKGRYPFKGDIECRPSKWTPMEKDDPSVLGLLRVEDQQMPIATATVHRRQYRTNRDSLIPIHNMIRQLESQGVISKTRSPFNSPIWPVRKSDGDWRLTVDCHGLNEVTPPLSATMLDMLQLQYELESKAVKCVLISSLGLFLTEPSRYWIGTAPGETQGQPLGFWSRGYKGSEANYTPTEKGILAAYEGGRAASEVIGPEDQLPGAPITSWMFKGKVPSSHHVTNATWNDLLIGSDNYEACLKATISLLNFLGLAGYRVSKKKVQIGKEQLKRRLGILPMRSPLLLSRCLIMGKEPKDPALMYAVSIVVRWGICSDNVVKEGWDSFGKLQSEREIDTPRDDSKSGCLDHVAAATRGSAGVDVATAIDFTLTDTSVHCIPSVLQGPLGHNLCALLLGRSSTSRKRIFVLPGVIDVDYT
ncbi:PREDICTED: uncharacterized protein LOC104290399, partial [Charadrius vociferus]|uniref:uncharacterized protein LOC104290399 n=1 Tax=Charadrius vociferus TaxID=50402 RepID=UPI00052156B7